MNLDNMKKTFFLLLSLFAFQTASALEITVTVKGIKSDSLFLYSYTDNYRWEKTLSLVFAEKVVLKSTKDLIPGMYIISSDSNSIAFFVISDQKSQKFTIQYENGEASYVGSPENSANKEYLKQMADFENQKQTLNVQYTAIMQSGEEYAVMETQVKWLAEQAAKLEMEKRNYQLTKAEEAKGSLLSSIIKGSIEFSKPSEEILKDRGLFENYLLEHHFDYFPWEDARILKTPVAINKFKDFAYLMGTVAPLKAMVYLEAMMDSLKRYPEPYYAFYDYMEKAFGNQNSPYWSQDIYLLMLRNMLTMPGLPEAKREQCEREIVRLDKNNPGDLAPDFPILLSTGDSTSLHAITSEYLILYLQNPDCPTCAEIRERMDKLPVLNKAIADGKVTVLTVYFEQNEQLWRNYLAKSANAKFLQGYDYQLDIENKKLYDTNVIPFIYVLNAEKRILAKDIMVDKLDDFLKTLKLY